MNFMRQMGILPPMNMNVSVGLIGAGGIGAATAIALAKMGIKWLEVYDFDTIEDVNIPNQLLRVSDIGKPKVASLMSLIKQLSDTQGVMHRTKIEANTSLDFQHIYITTVDSIEARKEIWENIQANVRCNWYLDARMGAELFQLYTIDMTNHAWYARNLADLTDDNVPDEPCTAKATIYTAFFAAGHIAHAVKRILMNEEQPKLLQHDIKNMSLIIP